MCSDHNLRVNPPLEDSHCLNFYAGARYNLYVLENAIERESIKDCLTATVTKGIWGFFMPPLMKSDFHK